MPVKDLDSPRQAYTQMVIAGIDFSNLSGWYQGQFTITETRKGTLSTEGTVAHYYDKGPKGALVVGESETHHSNGQRLFTNLCTVFARLDGGFGGPDAPSRVRGGVR